MKNQINTQKRQETGLLFAVLPMDSRPERLFLPIEQALHPQALLYLDGGRPGQA